MTLLLFLSRRSWLFGIGALAAGAAGGLCAAALIAAINGALNRSGAWTTTAAWGFAALVIARVVSGAAAQILVNQFSQCVLAELCQDFGRRLLAVPLPRLEAIGMPRVLMTLTEDVAVIAWGTQSLVGLVINVAILCGCGAYLGWLSLPIFLAVFGFVAFGTTIFLLLFQPVRRHWREWWHHRERLVGHLRALIDGIKDLKLNATRREAFLSSSIGDTLEAVRLASVRATVRQTAADAWSQASFFLLIGLLLFGVPSFRNGRGDILTGYLLVIIYMMSPLRGVVDAWPTIGRGRLAVERVDEMTGWLDAELPAAVAHPEVAWKRLELSGVVFAYAAEQGSRPFQLGPIDFTLQPGEVVFVTGGNGSGKSTFAKVLTGLYPAETGAVRLDGRLLTDETREWYHRHFSAIFSDFHLFDHLLGMTGSDLDARARAHLVRLELDRAVRVENGTFSTTALSSGQRKRLALLGALLDDRPIYVLDEWAADQDPHYRDIFYNGLLPELKRRGKAVVLISHDDRYYRLGDRTVRLAQGQMAS